MTEERMSADEEYDVLARPANREPLKRHERVPRG